MKNEDEFVNPIKYRRGDCRVCNNVTLSGRWTGPMICSDCVRKTKRSRK